MSKGRDEVLSATEVPCSICGCRVVIPTNYKESENEPVCPGVGSILMTIGTTRERNADPRNRKSAQKVATSMVAGEDEHTSQATDRG